MATTTELAPGQIAGQAGADKLRGELLSAHTVRCGNAWAAAATVYSDGAAEIEIATGYDVAARTWRSHDYYYSFELATRALRIFEETGVLPSEGDLG
jgi:hypothetical protein